uniref:Axin n=1 Tax=Plectus sambesii TaxID=2011161 RepID=A0A914X1H1_9BILA
MMSSTAFSSRPSTSTHDACQEERRKGGFGSKNGSPPTSADSSDEMSTPPHLLWAKSLEHVLNDREALDLFISWLNSCDHDDAVNINAIKFYYAIRGYKCKLAEIESKPPEDVETATRDVRRLAYEVYTAFIRETGDKHCRFIKAEVRDEVRAAVKSTTGLPHSQLFDLCEAQVMTVLRTQHAAFGQSDELMAAINRMERGEPSDGSSLSTRSPSVASQRFDEDSVVREMLEEGSDDEDGAAAPSIMTGYSDATTEPVTSTTAGPPPLPPRATSPRSRKPPPIGEKKPKPPKSGVVTLTRKTLLTTQTQRSHAVDQRCAPPYATAMRPMPYVCAANTSKNDSAVSSAFSSEASASQPYQPGQSHHFSSRQTRDEQTRYNPRNRNPIPRNDFLKAQQGPTDLHATQEQRRDFYNKVCAKLNVLFYKREMEAFTVETMSAIGTKQQDARDAVKAVAEFEREQQHNVNDEEEDVDVYLTRMNDSNKPSPGSHRSPGGYFAVQATQFRQRRSPKSTSPGPDHHRFVTANQMTASFPTPYGLQGFAPPPIAPAKHKSFFTAYHIQQSPDHAKSTAYSFSANKRADQSRPSRLPASDTSGIGTGASSADYSHVHETQPSKKAYEKLKQMSTANSGTQKRQKFPATAGVPMAYNSSSLPRQGRSQPTAAAVSGAVPSPYAHNLHSRQSHSQQAVDAEMTIGYYTSKDQHVPYVKKVPARPLTFKEFKHHFALGKNKNDQFFFKRSSDDPQNAFELLLVTEDTEFVPMFDGKVMAELKSVSDSD